MKLSTVRAMVPDVRPLVGITGLARTLYRAAFVAAASDCGLLALLQGGPVSREVIAARLGIPDSGLDALEAWLEVGVDVGEIEGGRGADGYQLRGWLARSLASGRRDPLAALLREVMTLHLHLILDLPTRLREGRPFTLADQDGRLIARSSRVLEPLVAEAIADAIPEHGEVSLLEVGCGSGVHLRAAAGRNLTLTGLGLELQPEVAQVARENLAAWGLRGRFTIEQGDVRQRAPEPRFDVVTLHNNIYYFTVAERVRLLAHLRGFLRPGGRLLLTTACRGGSAALAVLDLWSAATEGCGRLPEPGELLEQMHLAGLRGARARRLLPGESYYAFTATAPGGASSTTLN